MNLSDDQSSQPEDPANGNPLAPRPTWLEVDLSVLDANARNLQRALPPGCRMMAVVKANAYGHGALESARTLLRAGATYLGVAVLTEALQLRRAGIDADILVLGWIPPEDYGISLTHNITHTIYSSEEAKALGEKALEMKTLARAHLKVDTGMGRLGVPPSPVGLEEAIAIKGTPGIDLEGVYSHMATADEADKAYSRRQGELFASFISHLEEDGITFKLRHLANSATLLDLPEYAYDMVRPGIILYGLYPSNQVNRRISLVPVATWKARVSHVKAMRAGSRIGYGSTFVTERESVIATIPVGYADGYSRALSSRASVLINGQRCPVVGRVCMDQFTVDITDAGGVSVGDQVVLLGRQGKEEITAEELASHRDTINYEVVAQISARVPRVYTQSMRR